MKRTILLIAAYLIATAATAVEPTKPNIIVFYSDDHGYADLGIQGSVTDIKTPHLDALARSGVVAKNGYSTAPQCVPSRAGLLVGKFQGRFNLDSNGNAWMDSTKRPLRLDSETRDMSRHNLESGILGRPMKFRRMVSSMCSHRTHNVRFRPISRSMARIGP